ncbi:hypothetical protein HY992_00780 [Candidatus Micrarchaeota archaeon]|nr:hypothetical protein [Candidatus Micrarchaeota archaeon]
MNEKLERIEHGAKPAAGAHAIERLAGRRAEAEGIVKAVAARRITRADLDSLRVELNAREKQLLSALLGRVVLPSDSVFDGIAKVKDVWNGLNRKFRREYGQNAVVVKTFNGKKATGGGFYWLALNPELFEANEKKPKVGTHYNLRDVFMRAQVKTLLFLASRGYATVGMIAKATGASAKEVKHQLCYSLREQCRSYGFPNPVEKRGRNPTLYKVTARFAKHFGLTLESRICLGVFSEAQQKMVEHVRENPGVTIKQMAERFELNASTVYATLGLISERAVLFGLQAFEKHSVRMEAHYSLSQEFEKAVLREGKTKGEENEGTEEEAQSEKKLALSTHFTSRQAELIELIAKNPNLTRIQIAGKMGIVQRNVGDKMQVITQACRKRKLPAPFKRTGKWSSRYSVHEEFAKAFGLETTETRPELLLTPAQRKAYSFFRKKPNATTDDAGNALGIHRNCVSVHIRNANAVLKANGFGEITCKRRYSTRDKLEELVEVFIKFRRKNGRWPKRIELEQQKDYRAERIVGEHGEIEQARRKVWERLDAGQRRALMAPEWELLSSNGLFRKFGEHEGTIRRAALKALENGADGRGIEKIVNRNDKFGRLLHELEASA